MKRIASLLAIGAMLSLAVPAFAQQQGVLAPGATVEVETDATGFSSFSFWHDAKKAESVEIVGPGPSGAAVGTIVKQLTVDPDQRVGYSARYGGKKVKLQNNGDAPVNYSVD
jgi:hypothetical protein